MPTMARTRLPAAHAARRPANPLSFIAPGLLAATLMAGPAPAAAQDYYGDVRPLLVEKCMGCHTADGPGWSMEDPETTYGERSRIHRMVTRREMPPWLAEPGHQDYVGDLSLDDAAVRMVTRWAEGGYPRGSARPDARPAPGPMVHGAPGSFKPDLSLEVLPRGGYLPEQESSDDYHCFVVEWEGTEPTYVTGFRAVPGNRNVAHHVVVYAVEPGMADRYRELDAEREGDGWQCFGGALPDDLFERSARAAYEARYPDGLREMDRANFWLAHWAPGMDGHVFPEGTGIRMDPGSLLVVQMHYYSSTAPGERDRHTGLDFMVAPEVERPAFHLAQTRGDWLGASRNETMVIPPRSMRTYEMSDNLGDLVGYISRITKVDRERIRGLEIHSANLHMHSFGHSGRITLIHDTGMQETLLSIPRWDLAWQRDFTFRTPKVFDAEALEDVYLGVECTYRNNTDETVFGGYGSMEEMCFNFSYIAVVEGEPVAETGEGAARRER